VLASRIIQLKEKKIKIAPCGLKRYKRMGEQEVNDKDQVE